MVSYIGLDFETYGGTDLPKHGLHRYVNCPTFKPLIACSWSNWSGRVESMTIDLVQDKDGVERLGDMIAGEQIVAHNAPFERAVLASMGIRLASDRFLDSAVLSRAVGGGSKLEVAAPQLLDSQKLDMGKHLIKKFSIPGKLQEANGSLEFDPDIIKLYPQEWESFKDYCMVDAKLGFRIVDRYRRTIPAKEWAFNDLTSMMNDNGWYVDLTDVRAMQRIYEINTEEQLLQFRDAYDPKGELNFNSHPQLVAWCAARNVKAKSFDEANVVKMLELIRARIKKPHLTDEQKENLRQVIDLLLTKQMLGGSSLKKLATIENMVGTDGRLHDSYLHIGAGQTWRTSGKGVQMQNLKRLGEPADMLLLHTDAGSWDNDELARNLRQVFRAEHPQGELIVGDFSSIESRGLAYAAGAEWKLQAYHLGSDMYKVLAAKIDGTSYDDVTKDRRQFGKVGELSCGYGAGGGAVKSFAEKMGTKLTEQEAGQLVTDWRGTNPEVLVLWELLDMLLKQVIEGSYTFAIRKMGYDLEVKFEHVTTPESLLRQHPGSQSVRMSVLNQGDVFLERTFHGCYMRGNNVGYYKPTDLLSGDPWKNHYRHPTTKEIVFFTLYGGKLAGLLTQSLCRQMFFESLETLASTTLHVTNVKLIGQFHDEIVMEWQPEPFGGGQGFTIPLDEAMKRMQHAMMTTKLRGFPLAADIKHDHRYTK
jgi:DNA polymerase bacteriophage-type